MTAHRLWYSTALLLLAPALAGLAQPPKDPFGDPLPEGAKARLGTARLRVQTYSPAVLSPDGKSLFVPSGAGLIRLDPATGAQQGKPAVEGYGTAVALSPDGKRLATVNYGGVSVWDLAAGKSLVKVDRRLPSTDGAVALSSDGNIVALGGLGDRSKKELPTALVWDVAADKQLAKVAVPQNEHVSVALSGDGKTLACWGSHFDPDAKGPPDPATNPNKLVTFWNVATGKEQAKFRIAGYMPAAIAFSPDGSLAAVAGNNGTIDLVDPKTGASKHLLLGRSRMGRALAFSPDGATLIAAADDGAVQRWKAADGSRLSTTEPPAGPPLFGTRCTALSAEKGIAWGMRGASLVVWEIPSGKLISPDGGHAAMVRGLAVTPDGKHVLTSADDGVTLKWEFATGKPAGAVVIRTPNLGYGGYLSAATLSPDATHALVRDPTGGIGVHDLATGQQQYVIPVPPDANSLATFTPDSTRVIVASSSYDTKKVPGRAEVWDVAGARRLVAVELPGQTAVTAALTPDGKHVVTAGRKPDDKGNGEFVVAAWEVATGAKKGEFVEEGGFTQPQVATASDNKTAAVVTAKGKLAAFDLMSGKLGKTYDLDRRVPGLAPVFSPDGKRLAVAGQNSFGPTPNVPVLVLDWPSGEVKSTLAVPANGISAMAFAPDGKSLVTGLSDTTAIVWDVSK